jgi:hypothetical protein
MMRSACPYDAEGRTWAQLISLTLCRRAVKGDVAAAREIGDRTEGKPMQALSVSGGLDMNMAVCGKALQVFDVTRFFRAGEIDPSCCARIT